MEWVIMDNHSFSFVEKPLTKKHTKLEPINVDTWIKYIKLITEYVEKDVANDNEKGKKETRNLTLIFRRIVTKSIYFIIEAILTNKSRIKTYFQVWRQQLKYWVIWRILTS